MTNLTERLMKPLADRIGSTLVTNPAFSIMEEMDFEMAEAADAIETLTRQRDEAREALKAAGKPIAWESTTVAYTKFITDERYQKLRPAYQTWYKPYRCSSCVAAPAVLMDDKFQDRVQP